jgi:curved DNA-binding protein CbpA
MNNNNNRTHYEVLGVDPSADLKTVRQAYLRASLQHHPDKNLDNVEAAKAQFIVIGQAYDVLKDPTQRAQYDRELRAGTWRSKQPSTFQPPVYDNYRDAFDAHLAGMSQAELQAAMGAAAIVGSIVGSFIASRATATTTSRGSQSLGSSLLSTAGSLVGSVAASQAASSFVNKVSSEWPIKKSDEPQWREGKFLLQKWLVAIDGTICFPGLWNLLLPRLVHSNRAIL